MKGAWAQSGNSPPERWVWEGVEKPVSYSQLSLKADYAFNRGARSEFLLSLKGHRS